MPPNWRLSTVRHRIYQGAKQGIVFGVGYSLYALILLAFRGSDFFSAQGVGVVELLVLYLAGGIIAGAVCGGLEPLTGSLFGRMLVGIIAALPFAFLLGLSVLPEEDVRSYLVPAALIAAFLWGIIGGAMFWYTRD